MGLDGRIETVPELASFDTKDIVEALRFQQKVIYGVDNRQEIYQLSDPALLTDADSVVALVMNTSITDNGNGTSTLNGSQFSTKYQLCSSEPFGNQPVVAFCTGFLVDPSIIATAAHCVQDSNLSSVRFVFGFEMENATTAETKIPNSEIYRGIRILGRQIGIEGTDWALVQLDRPVLNHRYVRVRRTGKIADNSRVHVIGHPCGIPKKCAGDAVVRSNSQSRYFVANLDTYGGNSGSPVFNSVTHEVEGILVRGETDFVRSGSCYVSNVCPANGCQGEDCTRTTEFDELVPRNRQDCIPFNPERARMIQVRRRWKIEVDGMWLLDFGTLKNEAERALKIIQHYGMNSQCFVGRPHPSMEFYLVKGMAPQGTFPGEDAIPFNPQNLQVQRIQGRWKIVEGSHWLMDFDQLEDEARQALSYILRYGFRYICFVGRPDPSMTYFRK
ncbi:trypsin-like serine peptidase [Egbenema bharatensis]|uniref:trypsin-like serine peptidase n=1 Tax=Egbenema bharatensis TaxID=3463334 RepID=UPI003A8726DF